jgi:hypothetical protein
LLVVGTHRDVDASLPAGIAVLLRQLSRRGWMLPLRRLGRDSVAELGTALGGASVSQDAVDRL